MGCQVSDHPFIEWLAREVYMDQVHDAEKTHIPQVVSTSVIDNPLQRPNQPLFLSIFKILQLGTKRFV